MGEGKYYSKETTVVGISPTSKLRTKVSEKEPLDQVLVLNVKIRLPIHMVLSVQDVLSVNSK